MSRPRSQLDTSTYAGRTAARLAELRQRHGYGMNELREALAKLDVVVSTSTLYAYERGREAGGADVPLNVASALARVYRLQSVREVLPEM
ncbi:MAG: helix-turn-helix transcriptional regulator [Pirellulaceae bacterium]